MPQKKWTLSAIMQANSDAGHYWFSDDTMSFFKCKVGHKVYQGPGGIFFVSSEKAPHRPRASSVRKFNPKTGSIFTAGTFNVLTPAAARKLAVLCSTLGVEQALAA